MPGFDRTGPEGKGSRTGRELGKCNPDSQKTEKNHSQEELPYERGFIRGFGRGKYKGRENFKGTGRRLGRNR